MGMELYYFEIEGITKDTYESIVEHVEGINKELEYKGGKYYA